VLALLATLPLLWPASVGSGVSTPHEPSATAAGVLFYTATQGRGVRSTSHVYRIRPDGSDRRALTTGPVIDQFLVAAPDGERVAFRRSCLMESRACTPGLLVVGRAGRTLRRLAAEGSFPGAWSPDGLRLAYGTTTADGIFVMNSDGKARRRLTSGYDGSPAWSPDGSLIGFLHRRSATASTAELIVIGADGRGRRSLARASSGPVWSPDGRRLLFERDGTLYIVPSAGGMARRVGPGYRGGGWSPEGRLLALQVGHRIDIATGEGSMRRPLDTGRSRVRPYVHQPMWSPDGKSLAFVRSAEEGRSAEIWVIRPDGTGRRRIAAPGREVELAWTR
jgi:hypothetical protein